MNHTTVRRKPKTTSNNCHLQTQVPKAEFEKLEALTIELDSDRSSLLREALKQYLSNFKSQVSV